MFQEHLEQVGPGWTPILQTLEKLFQGTLAGLPTLTTVEIQQVKEKFGALRVYFTTTGVTSEAQMKLEAYVNFATSLSMCVCEQCGRPGTTRTQNGDKFGWLKTFCEEHHAERDAKTPPSPYGRT